jgi:predicted porin
MAFAEPSVTMIGRVDTYIERFDNAPASIGGARTSTVRLNSGGLQGSRWGFDGTEKLDDSLQLFFRLENGFNADTGTLGQGGRLFGRNAYIGLRGSLGDVRLGRQYVSMFDMMEPYSISKFPTVYEPAVQWVGAAYRQDNMVKYSYRTGPVSVVAHYAFGEVAGSKAASSAFGGGLSYSSGDFGIAMAYDDVNSALSPAGVVTRARKLGSAMGYNVGRLRIFGGFRWAKNDVAAAGLPLRDNFYFAGFNYKAAPMLKLSAAYYYDQLKSRAASTDGATRPNPWTVLLLGIYSLSKRTELYASAAHAKNSALNFDSLDGSATGYALAPGATSQNGLALGLRQFF